MNINRPYIIYFQLFRSVYCLFECIYWELKQTFDKRLDVPYLLPGWLNELGRWI